ncbi:MAG: cytochrome c3 family protein [Bacteroidales bacterium]|nr:cytochrome c3 family protein [Bacteroidales bacterium]
MKKLTTLLTISLLLAIVQLGFAQITGSSHDFSGQSWNTTTEICIVCHTPHNADVSVLNAPLWNHSISSVATYTMYSSATLNSTAGQPDGSSKLCLSCHDGTVALENFGGVTTGTNYLTGGTLMGTDLGNDHPISITYDAALAAADGGLFNPNTTQSGLGGTISATMLIGDKMQCSSCHDVHNSAGINGLLLKSNSASALCLTCHNK